ncbi:MAG: PspC domain-containing protein [Acidobacteria bacterium]|nr:PspC domain-containing protein [Acidobacteriota bacterium]
MFCKKCRFPIEAEDLFCRRCGVETPAGKDAKVLVKQKLRRSRGDQRVAGVCGGVARYLRQDPKVVRALWAGASVLPPFPGLFAYGVCWAVMPKETKKAKSSQAPREVVETKSLRG